MTPHEADPHFLLFILFGRPGCGKTTVCEAALAKLPTLRMLDLDDCVPQWMRDNFARGVYPTLQERQDFVQTTCLYVQKQLTSMIATSTAWLVAFSFVNTDLRDTFRKHFPYARWILIDTNEATAQERIEQREGHFYKGKLTASAGVGTAGPDNECIHFHERDGDTDETDNDSDWAFAPVQFPHTVLHGLDPVEINANKLIRIIIDEQTATSEASPATECTTVPN